MRRIIVDASVILAGLFKDGTVRDTLLNLEDCDLIAPRYLRAEVERHLPEVAVRSKVSEETLKAVLEDLFGVIDLVSPETYSGSMDRARELARRAAARGDEDYIALALALEAPVWTLDKDFARVAGVTVLRTADIERL